MFQKGGTASHHVQAGANFMPSRFQFSRDLRDLVAKSHSIPWPTYLFNRQTVFTGKYLDDWPQTVRPDFTCLQTRHFIVARNRRVRNI